MTYKRHASFVRALLTLCALALALALAAPPAVRAETTATVAPTAATPEPATATVAPMAATPESATATVAPTTTTPAPATATPEPATATPEPATATPEPATATPEPATATPEPATATVAPTTAAPAPATATPTAAVETPGAYYPRAVFDASRAIVDVSQAVQGGTLTVALPIGVETSAGAVVWSNAAGTQSGWTLEAAHSPFYFSQDILTYAGDLEWRLTGAPEGLFDLSEGVSRDMLDVVPEQNDWNLAAGTAYNIGYAVFALPIRDDAPTGQKQVTFAYQIDAGLANAQAVEFTVTFTVAAAPTETDAPTEAPTDEPTDEPEDESNVLIGQMSVQTLKAGQSGVTLAVPVSYANDTTRVYSNRDDAGALLEPGSEGFSQEILDYIDWLELEITAETAAETTFPFSLSEQGVTKTLIADGVNYGYAVFSGLTVKSDLSGGTHAVPLTARYTDVFGETRETTLTALVNITASSSSYGGGGSSGVYAASTATPQARVLVESISTDPEGVQAGDSFELVLGLRNTSAKQYVQNMRVTVTSEDDALVPVSGSSTVYVDRIDAGALYELRFPVRASLDVPDRPLKVDVSIEYEDAAVSAQTAAQQLVVSVAQQMRLSVSEPVTGVDSIYALDSADVTLQVVNEGRTMLYNVTVTPESQNDGLILPTAGYLGNMEGGTSKNAELSLTPTEAGSYDVTFVISWEDSFGEKYTQERSLTFTALSGESEDIWGSGSYVEPVATDAPTGTDAGYILELLPWWIYAAVAGVYLLVVAYVGFSVRARRRKVLEDDEMD